MDTKGSTGIGRWLWIGVACLPTAALPAISMGPARADEPLAVASSYGAGVHAYYDGDYQTAYDALTAAIEAGSLDPRAYYYRGLASIKLGRADDEIDGDFSEGASRESMGRGGLSVSRSLERVQGRDRMRLEKYRQRARVAAVQRDEAAIRQRYMGVQEAAPDVLRRRVPESPVIPAEPVLPPEPKARPVAPRAGAPRGDAAPPARPKPAPRATPETPDSDDPFADPTPRPGDDPFGDEPMNDDVLDQRDEQMEENAAEFDDRIDQRDQRMEENAAELDDRLDQIDAQQEREAAGGG
ncbi:MAG: hypothetical protein ACKO3G_01340 [Planctomycetaceae bacterium]